VVNLVLKMDDYARLAKDYDYLTPKEEIFKQKTFFRKLIKRYSIRSCLDCACGTGWHLFMLHGLGLKCFGSDLSPKMIALARVHLEGKRVPLKIADFRKLSDAWSERFDLIVCMTTSFPHMLTDKDALAALKSIYERLNEGGILVIDTGITDALLNSKPKIIPARILRHRAFYFLLEYPGPKRIVFNVVQVKKTQKSFKHVFYVTHYHAMRKSSFERYFARTPFRAIRYFGNYAFSRYSVKESGRLVIIAQK
jgi:glycine/sarcosine N-methyltransferase